VMPRLSATPGRSRSSPHTTESGATSRRTLPCCLWEPDGGRAQPALKLTCELQK
jgi:hypothetical protein